MAKLNKISFFLLSITKLIFLRAGILSLNFANFNILKILKILNKNVSFNPGNIRDGTNEIRSINEWNENTNLIFPINPWDPVIKIFDFTILLSVLNKL